MKEPKVLIVDDDPGVREFIRRALKVSRPDVRILEAESAEQGRRLLFEEQPEVAIIDWVLPGQDGLELAQYIEATSLLKDTRVIAISGHDDPHLTEGFIDFGAVEFLPKPFRVPKLLETVDRALG